jgi:LysR family glycine cleavage system transcriptional activator
MRRPLPPLNALRAFEATARHLSFTRAADELAVTPAALSHQIRGLEEFLGERLFERKARSIALTPAGATLYPGLHAAFLQIRQSVELLDRDATSKVLQVSAPPGFTAKWLAPRLYRFMMAHPDIDTRVSATRELANFTSDGIDLAIRNSSTSVNGMWSRQLMQMHLLPVASPRFIGSIGGLTSAQDLKRTPLIHDTLLGTLSGMPTWAEWLEAAGVAGVDLSRGLRFNSPDYALEAACEGGGVLLAIRELAHEDLRSGRLVAPFDLVLPAERYFTLTCPDGTEKRPKVRAFIEWILAEAERMKAEVPLLGCVSRCPPAAPAP